jgi:hypothetical protein
MLTDESREQINGTIVLGRISSEPASYSNSQLGKALQGQNNLWKTSTMAPSSTVRAEKQQSKMGRQRANPDNAEQETNTTPAPAAKCGHPC